MTEQEWLAASDPAGILNFLAGKASDRKVRLFGCACCRRVWHFLIDERSRGCVEIAERYADGKANAADLRSAAAQAPSNASLARHEYSAEAAASTCYPIDDGYGGEYHVSLLAYDVFFAVGEKATEYTAQCHILRDIFGNPFRPVSLEAEWLTSTVVALATGIYEERAFDRMPILADALQDAGCTNEDVLSHCRDTSLTHVRGCWVVDLVLGKG